MNTKKVIHQTDTSLRPRTLVGLGTLLINRSGLRWKPSGWLAMAILSFACLTASAQELAISRNASDVILTWGTNYPNYTLETTTNLTGSWTNVAGATNFTATLPIDSPNQFFRLKEMVSVTYVANEGFLVSGHGRKVLIDAIFTNGYGYFQTPPTQVVDQARNATAPFDDIDALLVTHYDEDHLGPLHTFQHMTNDTTTILIGPSQVYSAMESAAGTNFGQITNRFIVATPATGTSTNVTAGDLTIKVAGLDHINDPSTKNDAYLFTIGGLKFFHTGDFASLTLADWQALDLAGEQIDVAMLNGAILDNKSKAQTIIAYLNPKNVFFMHFPPSDVEYYRGVINSMTNLPPVYVMGTNTMTTCRFPAR